MGWGRLFLLGSLGQQLDLQDHEDAIEYLERRRRYDDQRNRTADQRT